MRKKSKQKLLGGLGKRGDGPADGYLSPVRYTLPSCLARCYSPLTLPDTQAQETIQVGCVPTYLILSISERN